MRLFLLPISTRRTLLYCERVPPPSTSAVGGTPVKPPIQERILSRVSNTWATWERAEKGWQKYLTVQGNRLFKRIPYEEWGLKSIPPATKKRLKDVEDGKLEFECLYPGAFMEKGRVKTVLEALAKERQGFHRRRMWWSVAWMPVTIPFALVPVIPNIPFFYACFRAYSHYRALYGGKLLENLIMNNRIRVSDSPIMDQLYTAGLLHPHRAASREAATTGQPSQTEIEQVARVVEAQTHGGKEEIMVLQRWNGKLIAERFKLPEMEVEIERAVEQVEVAIEKEKKEGELQEEKEEVMRATTVSKDLETPEPVISAQSEKAARTQREPLKKAAAGR